MCNNKNTRGYKNKGEHNPERVEERRMGGSEMYCNLLASTCWSNAWYRVFIGRTPDKSYFRIYWPSQSVDYYFQYIITSSRLLLPVDYYCQCILSHCPALNNSIVETPCGPLGGRERCSAATPTTGNILQIFPHYGGTNLLSKPSTKPNHLQCYSNTIDNHRWPRCFGRSKPRMYGALFQTDVRVNA